MKERNKARPGNPVGDPACIWAEPKEALQGTSLCERNSRHQKGNGRAARRRQERSARGAGRRERSAGAPGPGKKQQEEGRAWEEHGGAQRGVRATVGRGGLASSWRDWNNTWQKLCCILIRLSLYRPTLYE